MKPTPAWLVIAGRRDGDVSFTLKPLLIFTGSITTINEGSRHLSGGPGR